MIKPYVIMISKSDNKYFCLDRNYSLIPENKVFPHFNDITLSHIVQVDSLFFPSFEYQYPEWAKQYLNFKEDFVSLWTDYYD